MISNKANPLSCMITNGRKKNFLMYYFSTTGVSDVVMGYTILQKQPTRGVPKKRCSENMQQIWRRIYMPKCNFNKVAKQNRTSVWVFSCKFAACFQNTFSLRTPLDGCFWYSFVTIFLVDFIHLIPYFSMIVFSYHSNDC